MRISKNTPRAARVAYTVDEYCDAIRMSRGKCYEMMRNGELPFFIAGGRRHISADVVEAQIRGELPGQAHQPTDPTRRRKGGASA
jgi:excisionase family DNA binding protein